jgi:transposase
MDLARKLGRKTMTQTSVQFTEFVGIDVSKAMLDVHYHPGGESARFENSPEGLRHLIAVLARRAGSGTLAVGFEATGDYERHLGASLCAAGIPAYLLDAGQAKSYARAERQRIKNDAADAAMIARALMALHHRITPYTHRPQLKKLISYMQMRETFVDQTTLYKARLESIDCPQLRQQVLKDIEHAKDRAATLTRQMNALIAADHGMAEKARIIASAPGIGPIITANLIARMPELGQVSSRAIAALLGVAPFDRQSGTTNAIKRCSGGRPAARRSVYLAAITIIRMKKGHLHQTYERLIKAGKPFKVAVIAVMRKLIIALNAMTATKTPWKTS